MTDIADRLRAVIQEILDDDGDGWMLTQFVLCLGIERVADGVESAAWYWAPPEQAEWMTAGLLEAAREIRETSDNE